MIDALKIFARAFADTLAHLFEVALLNLVWLGLSLTVVLLPAATAGLYAVTYSFVSGQGQSTKRQTFQQAARAYWRIGVVWALVNLAAGVTLYVNLTFYLRVAEGFIAMLGVGFMATLAFLWGGSQFYFWPFLMAQEQKGYRVALKNALLLTMGMPFYTLTLVALSLIVFAVSLVAVLPLVVLTMSFLALLGNRALVEGLAVLGKLPVRLDDEEEDEEA